MQITRTVDVKDILSGYVEDELLEVVPVELSYDIEVDYRPGRPAKITGPMEDCYPADPDEVDPNPTEDDAAIDLINRVLLEVRRQGVTPSALDERRIREAFRASEEIFYNHMLPDLAAEEYGASIEAAQCRRDDYYQED